MVCLQGLRWHLLEATARVARAGQARLPGIRFKGRSGVGLGFCRRSSTFPARPRCGCTCPGLHCPNTPSLASLFRR